jgi:hypothetical protein
LYPRPVANGESWFHVGVFEFVGLYPFVELSANRAPDTLFNNKETVPDDTVVVKGVVDGVNVEVYKATDLVILKFVKYPLR